MVYAAALRCGGQRHWPIKRSPLFGCEQGGFVYAVKFRDSAEPAIRRVTVCRCGQAGAPRGYSTAIMVQAVI